MEQIRIPVAEMFGPTIQGEGPDVGKRTIFVRVCGCDFSCDWCDSKFAWTRTDTTLSYTSGRLATKIINMCKENNCYNVILTGGNPCLYDFTKVIKQLHKNNISVGVETQGSITPEWLKLVDTLVFSPKPPSSKQKDVYISITDFISGLKLITRQIIAIKIPIFNNEDLDFARQYSLYVNMVKENCKNVDIRMYLSVGNIDTNSSEPIRDRILAEYEELINKVNKDPMYFKNVYILPQVHTLIWGNRQGV